jgi:hypothetical protein
MQEYTFKVGPFYFKIHADDNKEAVTKARRAIEQSFPDNSVDHLEIDLDGGAFLGRLYIETEEITVGNILKVEELPELALNVPF